MSIIHPNETAKTWRTSGEEAAVAIYLDPGEGSAGPLADARAAGFPLSFGVLSADEPIDASDIADAAAVIVQVNSDDPQAVAQFKRVAEDAGCPAIAAAYEPPLAFVRALVRAGAHDVIPLPLNLDDLETSLAPVRESLTKKSASAKLGSGKLVTMMKSVGGVGATALLGQLAIRFAAREAVHHRETCLIDLDIQFGDAAFQLGLQSKLSVLDLFEAGTRLDAALLRATTVEHSSGLKLIAPPPDIMPLESVPNDNLLKIVELARREFSTVFVELPTNWTNWSLSLVARSDLTLLVTELSVAGLNRARRQLNLLYSQDLGGADVRVIVNRYDKSAARTIRPADVREALGRDASFTIANDFALMRGALDRGIPIDEVKRKSALGRDLDTLDAGIAQALGRER